MKLSSGSVKAIVQNKVTQMYLCPKGYWNTELKYVTYLDKHALKREIANLNATFTIVRS
jgi:hypothetical protein